MVRNGKGRDAKVTVFLDGSNILATRSDGCLLVTTTFAATGRAGKGTFDTQEFRFRVVLLDRHGESVSFRETTRQEEKTRQEKESKVEQRQELPPRRKDSTSTDDRVAGR